MAPRFIEESIKQPHSSNNTYCNKGFLRNKIIAGNKATKTRTVIVKEGAGSSTKDTTKPVITFKNLDTHQTVCIGEKIDVSKDGVYGYSAYDDVDKDITNNNSTTSVKVASTSNGLNS